ncbi:MAG: hypothetical protein H6740_26420, partial [Alphaproteobacteria bacterium]|nr:hypothetical protein [Alphaproteobacteria bacterium]
MVPCPACKRSNAPHLATCMYCGAQLPAPSAPPPDVERRDIPENLDELFAEAMRKGSTRKLAAALGAEAPKKRRPAPPPAPALPPPSAPA